MIGRRAVLLSVAGICSPLFVARGGDDHPPGFEVSRRGAGDVAADLVRAEREWAEAVVNLDRAGVERVIGDDFSVTDSTGHVWERGPYLDAVVSGVSGLESLKIDDLGVRDYGDVAVVTGRLTYRAGLGRSDLNGAYRFTKTYLRRGGRWRCVVAQEGRIIG